MCVIRCSVDVGLVVAGAQSVQFVTAMASRLIKDDTVRPFSQETRSNAEQTAAK